MDSTHNSPRTVLYVEDDADDFALLKLASQKCGTPFSLKHAEDGDQAIAYLSGNGAYFNREECPFPDLVLLDLKLPRLDGYEKGSFTGAATSKPGKFEELQVLIDQIADVWLAREKAHS